MGILGWRIKAIAYVDLFNVHSPTCSDRSLS